MNKGSLFKRNTHIGEKEKKKPEIQAEMVISAILLAIIGIFLSCLQIRLPKIFGITVPITLAFVSATGFLFGEKYGAVAGILTGFLLDSAGSVGFSLCVLVYMLCGYFCGALKGKLLSEGLPSYLVFSAAAGLVNSGATVIYHMIYAENFSPLQVIFLISLPELLSHLVICPVIYLLLYPVSKIKIKQK